MGKRELTEKHLDSEEEFITLWKNLKTLAFHQQRKVAEVFPQIHCMLRSPRLHPYYRPYLDLAHTWLTIPQSFWAVDFIGLSKYLLTEVPKGQLLSPRLILLIKFVRHLPPKAVQEIIADHERDWQHGIFSKWMRTEEKYVAYERSILASDILKYEWEQIKAAFPVSVFRSEETGIVRRRMVCERNFKIGWEFIDEVEALFEAVFTAFCADWNLYGMGYDKPLLLKLSVNNSPFGTQSMYPKYMNVDGYRDINWATHGEIPKAYGVVRESVKALDARRQREDEAIRTYTAYLRAMELGLKGPERIQYIITEARLPIATDDRKIRKIVAAAKELLEER